MRLWQPSTESTMSETSLAPIPRVDMWGYDPELFARVWPSLEQVARNYFRLTLVQQEAPSYTEPKIFVANRCGFLPLDAVLAKVALDPLLYPGRVRPLLEDYVFTIPYVGVWLSRLGCVRACQENARRLLKLGDSVLAFPEGTKGAQKTVFEAHKVLRFGRGGIVRLALATGNQVLPVGIAGVERAYPMLWRFTRLGRAMGLPCLPVTATFPLLGPLGLLPMPTKVAIAVGRSIDVAVLMGTTSPDEAKVLSANESLRAEVVSMLHKAMGKR